MFVENYLPQCLAIGISEDKFWSMTPRGLKPYRKAEELKREKLNADCHLMGAYVFEAVTIAISNALRKSGANPMEYPEKPYQLTTPDNKQGDREKQKAELIKAKFLTFALNNNKRLSEEE